MWAWLKRVWGREPAVTPTPTRGVPVMLDRMRYMRFTLRVVDEIRKEFGADSLEKGFSGDNLARVLWYGLRGDDPTLTQQQVMDMVDLGNLQPVIKAMTEAFGGKSVVATDPSMPLPTSGASAASGK